MPSFLRSLLHYEGLMLMSVTHEQAKMVRKLKRKDNELKERLENRAAAERSPYYRAAARAIRELTGRNPQAKARPDRLLLVQKESPRP